MCYGITRYERVSNDASMKGEVERCVEFARSIEGKYLPEYYAVMRDYILHGRASDTCVFLKSSKPVRTLATVLHQELDGRGRRERTVQRVERCLARAGI